MPGGRPAVDELELVPDEEWVFRLVHPSWYSHDAADGERLQTAALSSKDYSPHATSYGSSVYVESRLPNGLADIEQANPKWTDYGVVRMQVAHLRAFKIEVRYSPQDCVKFPALADAHASFVGMTPKTRDEIVDAMQKLIVRPPKEQP